MIRFFLREGCAEGWVLGAGVGVWGLGCWRAGGLGFLWCFGGSRKC